MGDKSREEFEAWAALQLGGSFRRYDDGCYRDDDIENAWLGWEASRAALMIELPFEVVSGMMRADQVISSIEAAGIKVKS